MPPTQFDCTIVDARPTRVGSRSQNLPIDARQFLLNPASFASSTSVNFNNRAADLIHGKRAINIVCCNFRVYLKCSLIRRAICVAVDHFKCSRTYSYIVFYWHEGLNLGLLKTFLSY